MNFANLKQSFKKHLIQALLPAVLAVPLPLAAAPEVRLAVPSSFELPKDALAAFEQENRIKVAIVKMGAGNEMANRLILLRGKNPPADAVYGLDGINIHKVREAGVLAAKQPQCADTVVKLPGICAVDYGWVALNYDKKWFAQNKLPLPQTLEDLAKPQYRNLLAMPNPGTSGAGLSFLLANIAGLGEEQAFAWWAQMRKNGVKTTKGWSEAYYTEFTLNGGSRPMMVGYAASPAAEVFYSEGRLKAPDMGSLFLKGGVYLQTEGAAVLNHAKQPEAAAKLVRHLQSSTVQRAIPAAIWMYPAVRRTPLHPAMIHAPIPKAHFSPRPERIAAKQKEWVGRWIRTVLK